ncbi:hypothetical protein, partial [Wohlfahrtiimonas populi]|uniref:hypothetical protein n=1 Tax=Wohlfahrtiimonas populi TaxID=1940240 RepID=UPI0011816DBC
MKEATTKEAHQLAQQKLLLIEQSILQLTELIEKIQTELNTLNSAFVASLNQHQFMNESAFLSARLPNDIREQLSNEAKQLEQKE